MKTMMVIKIDCILDQAVADHASLPYYCSPRHMHGFCLHLYTIYALQNTFHIAALTGRLREMRKSIHISVPMVMCVCVWTCVDLVILRGIIMMNMNNKNRRTVVMSSAGFLVKTGVQEMLVIKFKIVTFLFSG